MMSHSSGTFASCQQALLRLSQAATSSSPTTQATFLGLAADVATVSAYVAPGCDVQKLVAAPALPGQMCKLCMLGCRVVEATTDMSTLDPSFIRMMAQLSECLGNFVSMNMDFGRMPELPEDLMPTWQAAAESCLKHDRQQKQQQQQERAQPSTESATEEGSSDQPSPDPQASGLAPVVLLASALMRLWGAASVRYGDNQPLFAQLLQPTLAVAAELGLLLLTTPDPEGGDSTGDGMWRHACHAGIALQTSSTWLMSVGQAYLAQPTRVPAAVTSDALQKGLTLHLALLLTHLSATKQKQQRQAATGSDSGSAAPTPGASQVVKEFGVAASTVRTYVPNIIGALVLPEGQDEALFLLSSAFSALQMVLMLRATAGAGRPAGTHWAVSGNQATSESAGGYSLLLQQDGQQAARSGTVRIDASLFAPGVNPMHLQLMLLQFAAAYDVSSANMMVIAATLDLVRNIVQPAAALTDAATDAEALLALLRMVWLDMGRSMLLASGASAADVVADEATDAAAAESKQQWAFAAKASALSQTSQAGRLLWGRYAATLFATLRFANRTDVTAPHPAPQLIQQHPRLSSRVLEAATRVCSPAVLSGLGTSMPVSLLFAGMGAASKDYSKALALPEAAPLLLGGDNKLVSRLSSQLLSGLKALQVAAAPGFDVQMLGILLDIANNAATAGPALLGGSSSCTALPPANTQGTDGTRSTEGTENKENTEGSSTAPGGVEDEGEGASASAEPRQPTSAASLAAWLAVTGRSLAAIGQLQTQLPAWRAAVAQLNSSVVQLQHQLEVVMAPAEAIKWLHATLTQLLSEPAEDATPAEAPTAAVARAAARGTLQALQQQAADLMQQLEPLLAAGRAAAESQEPAALLSALQGFLDACAAGWLPQGLKSLGADVCAAFPQRFACNLPSCTSLEGLAEDAGNMRCAGCKVAHYCCQQHQKQHWAAHKAACQHLSSMAPAGAASCVLA